MLFLVRYVGQSDVHWRALNARTEAEAFEQALRLAVDDGVEYGMVDQNGIVSLGVIAAHGCDRVSA